jgi:hypothetical protein
MRNPTRSLVAVCGAAVMLCALLASTGLAQSAPWRIVQASDGTLYVLKDTTRYALFVDPIADSELATYVDGGTTGITALLGSTPAPQSDTALAPPTSDTALAPPTSDSSLAAPRSDALPSAPQPGSDPQFIAVQGTTPGRAASVTVQAPPGQNCSIRYTTPSGTASTAHGLSPQTVPASGTLTWSFLIGAATHRGTGDVTVTCNGATISSPISIG